MIWLLLPACSKEVGKENVSEVGARDVRAGARMGRDVWAGASRLQSSSGFRSAISQTGAYIPG